MDRQQNLIDRKAAPDARAREGNRANQNLMEGQLQQLGHISELSRRQHAIMNQEMVTARENFLKKPVSLQKTSKNIVMSRDEMSLR